MAGYTMTIHKTQGISLDRVKVNLERAFEEAMVYLALSRARTLEHLEVVALPEKSLNKLDAQVKQFYERITSA
ncbi:hypothetical protein BKA58DRAFT_93226 [Alternaria rosae]|uniref:uncharacterized protein n=1 Tax=Alternaria rosae TaxID=1187941 RepID=UPI001E8DF9B2|nr:uncharacterized protein BKA58DRAFT_93226 [Alternaria rosae]KAH6878323.1 hypothetical protein BKA58DRAFT_93226 [Alternaria rosae]